MVRSFHGGTLACLASSASERPRGGCTATAIPRTAPASALLISTGAMPTDSDQRSCSSASARRPSTARSATVNPDASAFPLW